MGCNNKQVSGLKPSLIHVIVTGVGFSWAPCWAEPGAELTYRMPFEESSSFPALFESLEQQPQRSLSGKWCPMLGWNVEMFVETVPKWFAAASSENWVKFRCSSRGRVRVLQAPQKVGRWLWISRELWTSRNLMFARLRLEQLSHVCSFKTMNVKLYNTHSLVKKCPILMILSLVWPIFPSIFFPSFVSPSTPLLRKDLSYLHSEKNPVSINQRVVHSTGWCPLTPPCGGRLWCGTVWCFRDHFGRSLSTSRSRPYRSGRGGRWASSTGVELMINEENHGCLGYIGPRGW